MHQKRLTAQLLLPYLHRAVRALQQVLPEQLPVLPCFCGQRSAGQALCTILRSGKETAALLTQMLSGSGCLVAVFPLMTNGVRWPEDLRMQVQEAHADKILLESSAQFLQCYSVLGMAAKKILVESGAAGAALKAVRLEGPTHDLKELYTTLLNVKFFLAVPEHKEAHMVSCLQILRICLGINIYLITL